jgi:nicotinamide riboside transporter PnuC
MSILVGFGYLAALISLIGIILNAKKEISCWAVWLVSDVMWIIYSGIEGDIPSIVLWLLFAVFNVYGWISWRKDINRKKASFLPTNYRKWID